MRQGSFAFVFRTLLFAGLSLAASPGFAAFTYSTCPDVTDADFKLVTLFNHATNPETSEPLKMDFDMDAQGNVDVYFTQRFGLLRKYDGAKKALVNIAKFTPVTTGNSEGLIGIALDPAFKANRWIYLFYTGTAKEWRVSRFTLNGEQLDMGSEKILLAIPHDGAAQHTGGTLLFDPAGNLWITVGDDNKPISSANSNDFRGKILRIHPNPDGTVSIPAGNLREAFNTPDKSLIKAEIYVMGSRHAYSLSYDPVRKGITWGDVGPDAGGITEEHDFSTVPGNFGWPFFAGNNTANQAGGGTPASPVNNDASNTGVKALPPAIAAIDPYRQACSITGPVYYYKADPRFPTAMPPHFDGSWFVSDFNGDSIVVYALDEKGAAITARKRLFKNMKFSSPIDFKAGPDGSLYVMNYAGYRTTSDATGMFRIDYTGSCHPSALGRLAQTAPAARVTGSRVSIAAAGAHSLEVADLSGRRISFRRGSGPAEYSLDEVRGPGVYLVTVIAGREKVSAKIVRP